MVDLTYPPFAGKHDLMVARIFCDSRNSLTSLTGRKLSRTGSSSLGYGTITAAPKMESDFKAINPSFRLSRGKVVTLGRSLIAAEGEHELATEDVDAARAWLNRDKIRQRVAA